MLYIIGQILGIVAVILGFVSFLMKSSRNLIFFQILTAFVFAAHYLFIGANTAVALNLLGAVRCIYYYFRNKRGSKALWSPIFFSVLTVLTSIWTWEGWYSWLIMIGLVINAISFSFSNPQTIRYSMFLKSPACLVYNGVVSSWGGVIYEVAVLISSTIGCITYRREEKNAKVLTEIEE